MANTRPFTYNNGSPIAGTDQIGDLAYGDLNDVNGGSDYSQNPGGKKWWMGPDEDNRYIIGKDVPTMDHPTPVPEGDIGSVRFWGSNKNDNAFVSKVNNLPARAGLNPFSEPRSAYIWLINNGYWTNYPYNANIDFKYVIYNTPDSSADSNIGSPNLSYRNIAYDSNNNRLLAAPKQNNDSNPQYGNFFINSFDNTLSTTSSLWYSGSAYTNQYLPSSTDNTTGLSNGDNIGQGHMALDNTNEVLYVCSVTPGTGGARGLIKYDLTDDSVIWSGPDNYTVPNNGKVFLDNSGDYVWLCGAVLASWNCRTTNGKFIGFIKEGNKTTTYNKSFNYIIPGPAHKALAVLSGGNEEPDYHIISGSSLGPSEPPYIHSSGSVDCSNASQIGQPIYLSSTNKWYIPHPRINANKRYNRITIVDGTTFQITDTIDYGYSAQPNDFAGSIDFLIYDSDRNYLWSNTADQYTGAIRYLVAIDLNTNSEAFITNTTYARGGSQQGGVYLDDYLIFSGNVSLGGNDRGILQKINVTDVEPL